MSVCSLCLPGASILWGETNAMLHRNLRSEDKIPDSTNNYNVHEILSVDYLEKHSNISTECHILRLNAPNSTHGRMCVCLFLRFFRLFVCPFVSWMEFDTYCVLIAGLDRGHFLDMNPTRPTIYLDPTRPSKRAHTRPDAILFWSNDLCDSQVNYGFKTI